MRILVFKLAMWLLKFSEAEAYGRKAALRERLILPNRLNGEINIVDYERDTETTYIIEDGKITYERMSNARANRKACS